MNESESSREERTGMSAPAVPTTSSCVFSGDSIYWMNSQAASGCLQFAVMATPQVDR